MSCATRRVINVSLVLLGCAWADPAAAGGSNYGIEVGALTSSVAGRGSEWPVPTPKFARDPAPGPDGRIYSAVMDGHRTARFDPNADGFCGRFGDG